MSDMAKVSFRCSDDQHEYWKSLARMDGRKLGDWIKRHLPDIDMTMPWAMPLPTAPQVKAVSLPSMREDSKPRKKGEGYLAQVTKQIAENAKRANEEYVDRLLNAPPPDAKIAGLKLKVKVPVAIEQLDQFEREQDAKVNGVNPMSRGVPKIPDGHSAKCTCLKCQKAKGWRG